MFLSRVEGSTPSSGTFFYEQPINKSIIELQLPQVMDFADYHEIYGAVRLLRRFHPDKQIMFEETGVCYGRYWGIFYVEKNPPSLEEISRLIRKAAKDLERKA